MIRLCLVLVFLSGAAHAYTVGTGFSESCHERITLEAYRQYVVDLPADKVPLPSGKAWDTLSAALVEEFELEAYDAQQRVLILSLVIGVRAPDTEGHALTDLSNTRRIHADPSDEGQYAHALRGLHDDGTEGDRRAIEGTREYIRQMVKRAAEAKERPLSEQLIPAKVYLDGYGVFDVEVWAPYYFLGRAVHALQDSFSHTLRSDSFRQVQHVMNYIEAIGEDHAPDRDGLRHSASMDLCARPTYPLQRAASEATIDLLLTQAPLLFYGRADQGFIFDVFLDRWLTWAPGCDGTNDYCSSRWRRLAEQEVTKGYLSCSSSDASPFPVWVAVLALLFAPGVRGRPGKRVPFVAALLLSSSCAEVTAPAPRPVLDCEAPFVPCGGDLTGAWAHVNHCRVNFKNQFAPPELESCTDVTLTYGVSSVGMVRFENGFMTEPDYAYRTRRIVAFPRSCLLDAGTSCEEFRTTSDRSLACASRGEACHCASTDVQASLEAPEPQPYSVEGDELILGRTRAKYCVQGDLLNLSYRDVENGFEYFIRLQLQRLDASAHAPQ